MVLVGGVRSGCCYFNSVDRFDGTGHLETLPSLNLARGFPGCSKYVNSNGEKVKRIPTCLTCLT